MILSKCKSILRISYLVLDCSALHSPKAPLLNNAVRFKTKRRSGAILPEPPRTPFGIVGVFCTVVPGLLIGATISKYIASFLEENDLFVPSDDDDDDD